MDSTSTQPQISLTNALAAHPQSPVADFAAWLASQVPYRVEDVPYTVLQRATCAAPFLSVVMRTQGTRLQAMDQALSSLEHQTDDGFEVIIAAHDAPDEKIAAITAMIQANHAALLPKITLVQVEGGSRSRPLNVGFTQAQGEYVSIFDDDDLVDEDWAAQHESMARQYPGCIVYSYVKTQKWIETADEDGTVRIQPLEDAQPTYCQSFTEADLLQSNRCPTLGLAYPASVFAQDGIVFDEQMNTLEDWDFLLRALVVCGIRINQNPTSIYRLWQTGDSSRALHTDREWSVNSVTVRNHLDDTPLVLPRGNAHSVLTAQAGERDTVSADEPWLFVDAGAGFTASGMLRPDSVSCTDGVNCVTFEHLETFGAICALRFDATEHDFNMWENIHVEAALADGTQRIFAMDDLAHNGARVSKDAIAFLKDDPKIVITLPQPERIGTLAAYFELRRGISDQAIDQAIAYFAEVAAWENQAAGNAQPKKRKGLFGRS